MGMIENLADDLGRWAAEGLVAKIHNAEAVTQGDFDAIDAMVFATVAARLVDLEQQETALLNEAASLAAANNAQLSGGLRAALKDLRRAPA